MAEMKIDNELSAVLEKLEGQDSVEALVFPGTSEATLEAFLGSRRDEGLLEFNVLALAGCIAVRAPKSVVLELATREDVKRIAANPKFSANP